MMATGRYASFLAPEASRENEIRRWLAIEALFASSAYSVTSNKVFLPVVGRIDEISSSKPKFAAMIRAMRRHEKRTGHEVVAFLTAVRETSGGGKPLPGLHAGLTSSNVTDTAQMMLLCRYHRWLTKSVGGLAAVLAYRARYSSGSITAGRTHGRIAEVTTIGMRMAMLAHTALDALDALDEASEHLVIKMRGPVGTGSVLGLAAMRRIEAKVAAHLGLGTDPAPQQNVSRMHHLALAQSVAAVAVALDKIHTDIRLLCSSGVDETSEHHGDGYAGSSSMPHKSNPYLSERICGISRVVRSLASTAEHGCVSWLERDLSGVASERIVFPGIYDLALYSTDLSRDVVENLHVDHDAAYESVPDEAYSHFDRTSGQLGMEMDHARANDITRSNAETVMGELRDRINKHAPLGCD